MAAPTRERATAASGARRLAWSLSGAASVAWVVAVSVAGLWGRVADHWESAVTMLFGSFLAGSSPEGGGAVAFPVFTKALDVPAPVARTFGLSIQAVGMSMAVFAILLNRRPLERRALLVGVPAAIAGFAIGLVWLGRPDAVFWPPSISSGWVKATFSIVLATTSILMVRRLRRERTGIPHDDALDWTPRLYLAVGIVALLGGGLSSLTGTGANIALFMFLVVVVGTDPKRALPTSIVAMAAVSVVGIVTLGIVDGQLDVTVVDDRVTDVGGTAVDLAAGRADLLGLWLAAVPIVVWGAPLGSWAAARVREATLVGFVAFLATVEVVTTLLLVDELRSNAAMIGYMAAGLVLLPATLLVLHRRRDDVFG